MKDSINTMIDALAEKVPKAEEEYLGSDGLLRCAKCHAKTETEVIHPFSKEVRKVRCKCACKSDYNQFEDRQAQEELDRKRSICFAESNMASWTFENDDRKNPTLSDAMKRYADNFTEFKKDGKGLILYGECGTGKTYLSACVANRLIDKGYRVYMTNFSRLANHLHGMREGKQTFLDSLNQYSLLIIDDLGAERNTEYMVEQVFNVIDGRYRSGLPMIITTNLSAEELKKPQSVEYARIYDRVLERCHPIKVDGVSRRRETLKNDFGEMQRKLGL